MWALQSSKFNCSLHPHAHGRTHAYTCIVKEAIVQWAVRIASCDFNPGKRRCSSHGWTIKVNHGLTIFLIGLHYYAGVVKNVEELTERHKVAIQCSFGRSSTKKAHPCSIGSKENHNKATSKSNCHSSKPIADKFRSPSCEKIVVTKV